MSSNPVEHRLNNISTNWDELIEAHAGEDDDSAAAALRGQVLRRYAGCAYQYVLGATKSHDAAEDLTQEFALKFVRGDFAKASPQQGRFRDYLKASLRNLITDFFRTQAAAAVIKTATALDDVNEGMKSLDAKFSEQWRKRVLSIAWESLQSYENEKLNHYYSVLHLRAQQPESSSGELAAQFAKLHDKEVTPEWIRQNLRRARLKFGELLLEEVGRTINSNDRSVIDAELASLGLKKYVAGLDL